MNEFAKWLENEIEQKELGINQVGKYSGVSGSTISNIINGKRGASPRIVSKIAKYFKADEDWLLLLAGHRTAKNQIEKNQVEINFTELRSLATPQNLNKLSEPVLRSIAAIIKAELEFVGHSQKQNEYSPSTTTEMTDV